MGFKTLIEGITADPQDFYALCGQEIGKRGIPNLIFDWRTLERLDQGALLSKTVESALALVAKDERHCAEIVAYPFGTNLYVETRLHWTNPSTVEYAEKYDRVSYLDDVRQRCFVSLIDNAVRDALKLYLEKLDAPIPTGLDAKDVFIVE